MFHNVRYDCRAVSSYTEKYDEDDSMIPYYFINNDNVYQHRNNMKIKNTNKTY